MRQPGLSLKETLDRAEATAACPARMPNLLALAAAIRPLNGNAFAGAARTAAEHGSATAGLPSSGGSKNHSQKRKGGAGIPCASDGAPISHPLNTSLATAADGQAGETEATGPKRRRVDVSAILCPFELNGVCNDDDCRYIRMPRLSSQYILRPILLWEASVGMYWSGMDFGRKHRQ